jgi:hypothetical protein
MILKVIPIVKKKQPEASKKFQVSAKLELKKEKFEKN